MFYNKKIFQRCFCYRGIYWYKNIFKIPSYIRQMRFLIKHGYDISAMWSLDYWFIDTIKPNLEFFRSDDASGVPILIDNFPCGEEDTLEGEILVKENEDKWKAILDEMLLHLNYMDENCPEYEDLDYRVVYKQMDEHKNKFFELFSKYFYNLWD